MTDITPRLTVITPTGDYPVGDPRANEALAAYVRSKAVQRLDDDEKIERLNAALAVVPQEGLCLACQRRLPLFLFDCQHWAHYGFSHRHALWLCTRDGSHANELAEDGRCICEEIDSSAYPEDLDPFTAPAPGTREWKQNYGPIGKIRSYGPDAEAAS